ncbi:MAG: glycosyltransferase family 2 protein [Muribaculum sp.]|nr:glycosyltransferase family 2 protein [Muribaculum sp.]
MISVCLAVYNGEKYIREQLQSILEQLSENDEVIISDDGSKDKTVDIILSFNDPRIRVFLNSEEHGPVGNFENALKQATGEHIFLSDQDDIWLDGRVSLAVDALKAGAACVICNRNLIDKNGITISENVIKEDFTKYPFWKVLLHNPYIGCCMAFTKRHLELCLPFPKSLPMHDWWIGLLAHKQKKVKFIEAPLISYRRHGNNVTTGKSPYTFLQRIVFRVRLHRQLYKRLKSRLL